MKAFVAAGNYSQYVNWLRENKIKDRREYPYLTDENFRGMRGVKIIRYGTFYENPMYKKVSVGEIEKYYLSI